LIGYEHLFIWYRKVKVTEYIYIYFIVDHDINIHDINIHDINNHDINIGWVKLMVSVLEAKIAYHHYIVCQQD
jgi:hypothetical protein